MSDCVKGVEVQVRLYQLSSIYVVRQKLTDKENKGILHTPLLEQKFTY